MFRHHELSHKFRALKLYENQRSWTRGRRLSAMIKRLKRWPLSLFLHSPGEDVKEVLGQLSISYLRPNQELRSNMFPNVPRIWHVEAFWNALQGRMCDLREHGRRRARSHTEEFVLRSKLRKDRGGGIYVLYALVGQRYFFVILASCLADLRTAGIMCFTNSVISDCFLLREWKSKSSLFSFLIWSMLSKGCS